MYNPGASRVAPGDLYNPGAWRVGPGGSGASKAGPSEPGCPGTLKVGPGAEWVEAEKLRRSPSWKVVITKLVKTRECKTSEKFKSEENK